MKIEKIYLITWLQRTTIHLQEMYDFLRGNFDSLQLNPDTLEQSLKALDISDVLLTEKNDFETLTAKAGAYEFTAVEDGVFSLSTTEPNISTSIPAIEDYYRNHLGPSLAYLFSKGAPLPKELSDIKEVYPIVLIVRDATDEDIELLRNEIAEKWASSVSSSTTRLYFGRKFTLARLIKRDERRDAVRDELVGNIAFLREFSKQLRQYVNLHRTMWDEVSEIRESKDLRYHDFPEVRHKIMDFLKTLFFVKARLSQMGDIAKARMEIIRPEVQEELKELNMYRYENVIADQKYIYDLWIMTIEYVKGTLELLESLFQENTQRELNTLKFITLIGATTSFFGMNIAFPWEERWPMIFPSSLAVIGLLILVSIGFYYMLKHFIYNRHFIINK